MRCKWVCGSVVPAENSVLLDTKALTFLAKGPDLLQDYAFQQVNGRPLIGMLQMIMVFLKAFLVERTSLAAENMAPRHQLTVLQRSVRRPKLRKRDRIFWSGPSRLWTG